MCEWYTTHSLVEIVMDCINIWLEYNLVCVTRDIHNGLLDSHDDDIVCNINNERFHSNYLLR